MKNVEKWCHEYGFKLPSRAKTLLSATYRPELDVSEPLTPDSINWYQSALGVLYWAVELGRVDVDSETSIEASHMVQPRMGHLLGVLQVCVYLKAHHNARLVHDLTYQKVDTTKFIKANWGDFHGNVKEAMYWNPGETQFR